MRPKAIDVKPTDNYNLIVTFDNGEVKLYDAKPLIKGSWFGQLKDIKLFNTVHIAGISVEWASGQDVCPDDLYYLSVPLENEFKGNATGSSPNEFTPEHQTAGQDILKKYEFRSIRPEEADQAAVIEQICFPPNEACSEQHMKERIAKAPELFLVAVDRSTGKLAGFLNGLATDEYTFRDEFFTDANLYHSAGKNIMLLGLDVLPEYRRQGIAKELVYSYARRERENGRQMLILTCLKSKVKMYEKMGFADRGIANSTWGGEEWHEMSYRIGC